MEKIGADPRGVEIMASKGILRAIKLEGVGYAAANILKQEMLAKGGEAVLTSDIYSARRRRRTSCSWALCATTASSWTSCASSP
nr:hypothetical protein [Anaerolineae bacterium]